MHTQNVNVAASESSKTWVKAASLWSARKSCLLTELAKIEGDLLMYRAFEQMGIEVDDYEDHYLCPRHAAEIVESLSAIGAITSRSVLEMVHSVESLSLALVPDCWREIHPERLPDLSFFVSKAEAERREFLLGAAESLKPFCIIVEGRKEYPEDDSNYGTYWQTGSVTLGRAWTISEAMDIAAAAWLEDEWDPREKGENYYDSDFGRDMGPVSFNPQTFIIRDSENRKVLTGEVRGLTWHAHVTDPDEIAGIAAKQKCIYQEAAQESGWDNFETARQLRVKAEKLGAAVVDVRWMGHPDVIAALNAFTRPASRVWTEAINVTGLPSTMADRLEQLAKLSDLRRTMDRTEFWRLHEKCTQQLAGLLLDSVSDWSVRRPRIPAPVVAAWMQARAMVMAAHGDEYGKQVWAERMNEPYSFFSMERQMCLHGVVEH